MATLDLASVREKWLKRTPGSDPFSHAGASYVWSDYVCPFCYLEEPVLTKMQEQFGDQLAVHWPAFELRPDPVPTLPPRGDYLLDIWKRFLTSARDESAAQIWLRDLYAGAA